MEEILNEVVQQSELETFEKHYQQEVANQNVTPKTQFEYAWCLVRSGFTPDIQMGIMLLEDLCTRDKESKRDYIYYLAIGNTRLKNYTEALKYIKAFSQIEPNNQQVLSLEEYVRDKINKESLKGIAVASGAVLAIGGLVGLGIALAKNRSKSSAKK